MVKATINKQKMTEIINMNLYKMLPEAASDVAMSVWKQFIVKQSEKEVNQNE